MPLYEYECDACGHRFEVIQKFSDAAIGQCPLCAEPVHKLLSAPAIQFKGTGWYVTDYASKRNTEAAADRKSSASAGSSSDKSASSAKPSAAGDAGTDKTSAASSASDSGKTASPAESGSSKPGTASESSAAKSE